MLKKLLQVALGFVVTMSMALAAVNINTATEKELNALPGIGAVKAKAIVDYRKKNGNFKSVDDIQKVNGIGPSTFNSIKGQIAVNGPNTAPAAKEPVKEKAKEVAKDVSKETKKAATDVKADAKAAQKKVSKDADQSAPKAKK
ncbi:MAG TPA: helix-hairpin-helix domain-containing protein [Rhodocyclaceae bacterium]|nr:helix-hairpin-helix domain-containing protein [Rhodocyclaceae bacterium]